MTMQLPILDKYYIVFALYCRHYSQQEASPLLLAGTGEEAP